MGTKRHSKTASQQCRYYEVDNIFEYMVDTYINGNIPWRDFIKKSPRRFFSLLQPYLVFHLLSYFDESYCLEIVQHPCPWD